MVPTLSSVRSLGLLTAMLSLALMAPSTGLVQAGELQKQDSLLSPTGVQIAMSPQEKAQHEIHIPPKKSREKAAINQKTKVGHLCSGSTMQGFSRGGQ